MKQNVDLKRRTEILRALATKTREALDGYPARHLFNTPKGMYSPFDDAQKELKNVLYYIDLLVDDDFTIAEEDDMHKFLEDILPMAVAYGDHKNIQAVLEMKAVFEQTGIDKKVLALAVANGTDQYRLTAGVDSVFRLFKAFWNDLPVSKHSIDEATAFVKERTGNNA